MSTTEILLLLFMMFLGIAFGAGVYETRVVLPLWFRKEDGIYKVDEAIRIIDPGRRFWGMVTTVPLTLLTIINIIFAWQWEGVAHDWWLTASIIVLVERLSTFVFFIPTIIKLQRNEGMPKAKVSSMAKRWMNLNYVRNLLTLIAWVLMAKAILLV